VVARRCGKNDNGDNVISVTAVQGERATRGIALLWLSGLLLQQLVAYMPAPVGGNSVGKSVSPGHVRSDTTNGTDMHGLGTFDDTPHILSHGSNHWKLRTDAIGTVPVNGDWSVGLKMGGSTDERRRQR